MRTSLVATAATAATAVAAVAAGLTAAAVLRGRAARRRPLPAAADASAAADVSAVPERDRDAVVLPFTRPLPAAPAADPPSAPTRCGDTGGVTRAGAPCGARANSSGRCHHHALAA